MMLGCWVAVVHLTGDHFIVAQCPVKKSVQTKPLSIIKNTFGDS